MGTQFKVLCNSFEALTFLLILTGAFYAKVSLFLFKRENLPNFYGYTQFRNIYVYPATPGIFPPLLPTYTFLSTFGLF